VITAADTNVLLDVLFHDPAHEQPSEAALRQAAAEGGIVISDVVYAELSAGFADASVLDQFLNESGIQLITPLRAALHQAGRAWLTYARASQAGILCVDCGSSSRPNCRKCGSRLRGKQHLLADFLIGGHAMMHADRLLTRDRRHFKKYFPGLTLLHP